MSYCLDVSFLLCNMHTGHPCEAWKSRCYWVNLPDQVRLGTRTGKASLRQEVGRDLCLRPFHFDPWCCIDALVLAVKHVVNHLSFKFSFSLLQKYLQIFKATCGNYSRHKRNYLGTEKRLSKHSVKAMGPQSLLILLEHGNNQIKDCDTLIQYLDFPWEGCGPGLWKLQRSRLTFGRSHQFFRCFTLVWKFALDVGRL